MTKAGLAILVCEFISMHFLYKKYFNRSIDISMEEFLSRASLEDIIKMMIHQRNGFLRFVF